MTPDVTHHNPAPEYLRALIASAGLSQREAARRMGISARVMRYYLADPESHGYRPAPYLVQFAMEALSDAEITSAMKALTRARLKTYRSPETAGRE